MRSSTSMARIGALVLLGLVFVTFAGGAWADVKLQADPTLYRVRIRWQYLPGAPNGIENLADQVPHGPCPPTAVPSPNCLGLVHTDVNPDNRVIARGCITSPNCLAPGSPETLYEFAVCFGTAKAGGENTIQSLPVDSLGSSVGFFHPDIYSQGPNSPAYCYRGGQPGGEPVPCRGIPPLDSMLQVQVQRLGDGPGGVQDQIQLTFPKGGMMLGSANQSSHRVINLADLLVIGYPSRATANADSTNHSGAGSSFFARVQLLGPTGSLHPSGGFAPGDWFVRQDGTGRHRAAPTSGLTKTFNVPDRNTAVVTVIGDATSTTAVPGHSRVSLALMTIVLLGAGLWVIRSQRKAQAAA